MGLKLYYIIVKINKKEGFLTFNNVNNLVKFTNYLDAHYGREGETKWNFFNVYKRAEKNFQLGSYVNGKDHVSVPLSANEL